MAEHVWSVLCQSGVIDRDSNRVSLLEVPEKVAIAGEKALAEVETAASKGKVLVPMQLDIVSYWLRSDLSKPESGAVGRLTIVAPDGKRLASQEFPIGLKEKTGFRQRIKLQTLPYRGLGHYWFVIYKKTGSRWHRMTRLPLELVCIEDLASSAPSEPQQPS